VIEGVAVPAGSIFGFRIDRPVAGLDALVDHVPEIPCTNSRVFGFTELIAWNACSALRVAGIQRLVVPS
jgi:hypothetical protein